MNALDLAIEHLGGVGKLAAAINVGQAAVSNWRARETVIDAKYCTAISVATGGAVTRQMLRPNDWQAIWPELVEPVSVVTGAVEACAGSALGYVGGEPHG